MTTTQAAASVSTETATDRAERNLRRVLALDAAVGSVTAAGFLASTDIYHRVTGLSAGLLHGAAFVLLGYAVVLVWATVRRPLQRRTISAIV